MLTVHDSMDFVYWREVKWTLRHRCVDEEKSSTKQERWGNDLLQGEALLGLALSKLPTNRERDVHKCCCILLPLKTATYSVLLATLMFDVEHCQCIPSANCEIFQLQLCVGFERERKAWIQAHGPHADHFLHWAVRHLLWNHLKQAWETMSVIIGELWSRVRLTYCMRIFSVARYKPVWVSGSSNLWLLSISSQQTASASIPITFMRSSVEKHTSLPHISYIDPKTNVTK